MRAGMLIHSSMESATYRRSSGENLVSKAKRFLMESPRARSAPANALEPKPRRSRPIHAAAGKKQLVQTSRRCLVNTADAWNHLGGARGAAETLRGKIWMGAAKRPTEPTCLPTRGPPNDKITAAGPASMANQATQHVTQRCGCTIQQHGMTTSDD